MSRAGAMGHAGHAAALAVTAVLAAAQPDGARAFDDRRYPDLHGQWTRAVPAGDSEAPRFDPAKPPGRAQEPPLTAEYQAVFAANLRAQEAGAPAVWPGPACLPPGMPAQMTAYRPLEFVVLPAITYVRIDYVRDTRRRIYTDGRSWPADVEDGFDGYSIGRWLDEDNDGRYDVLAVETRHFKGPRLFDLSGIPLHDDNQTVIRERIFLDSADPDLLHDDMTIIDHALTRPWTVHKSYRRSTDPQPQWPEYICPWENHTIRIGTEIYRTDDDGVLHPTRPGQPPPSLKYFPGQR